ncbi:MAG TPA: hypothetical protein VM580_33185 [Labilithrix sp.]|nr:hypothetical protein [Labilithrix sp.]
MVSRAPKASTGDAPLSGEVQVRPGPAQRGKAKGVIVRPMLEWFVSEFGQQGLEQLVRTIDPRWLAELDPKRPMLGILPGGWYDEELASELSERVIGLASSRMTEAEALHAIGTITVDRSLGRISRAVVEWFVSPEAAAVSAQLSWRLYHSTGWISASVEGPLLHAVGSWGCHRQKWCAIVGASSVRVLELTGLKNVGVVRHICSGGGGLSCEMTVGWSV